MKLKWLEIKNKKWKLKKISRILEKRDSRWVLQRTNFCCFSSFCYVMKAPSENLVSREFSRFFFNFHFSFSISSHLSFTFNSRKRVKGIYFSLFTSRKKWKLSQFHSFFSRKKSEITCGVWPDISLSSQIVFFLKMWIFPNLNFTFAPVPPIPACDYK